MSCESDIGAKGDDFGLFAAQFRIRTFSKGLGRDFNTKTKKWKKAVGKAKSVGDPECAMLKVSFFGPFYAGYNVIVLDDEYKYALVSGSSRVKWILITTVFHFLKCP